MQKLSFSTRLQSIATAQQRIVRGNVPAGPSHFHCGATCTELQNCRIAELQNSSFLKQTTSFRTKTSSFLIFNDNTKSTSNGHGLSDSRDVMLMSCVKMGDETQSKISQKPSETSTKSHHLSWAAAIAASLCSVRVFPRGAGFTDRSIITDLRTYHTRSIDEFCIENDENDENRTRVHHRTRGANGGFNAKSSI